MIQIGALLLLICLAIQTSAAIHSRRDVFHELNQPTLVKWLIWLFPLPFALPLVHPLFRFLFFPLPLGVVFFVPAIAVSLANRRSFEVSGHPKAKSAETVVDHVIMFGIMGLVGLLVITMFLWSQSKSGAVKFRFFWRW